MGKEKIYTIPVTDAFKNDCECPICNLYENLEKSNIDFILSPAYMEVDIRLETNEKGFCKYHFQKLYDEENRLGLALILHSHIIKVNEDMTKLLKVNAPKKSIKNKLLKKENDTLPMTNFAHAHKDKCWICTRTNYVFNIYIDTIFYLWKTDKKFIELFKKSKGFCIEHFALLLEKAPEKLNQQLLNEFYDILIPLQKENFSRIIDELDWFVKKYDYRYKNEPWKNSKDSIKRGIKKIASLKLKE